MGYNLYDKFGKVINHNNLQDKTTWCKEGFKTEEVFIEIYGKKLQLQINPEKDHNPYAPDLAEIVTRKLADLKVQNTPFFKAQNLYNIPPTFAVVFNLKDKLRYEKYYPQIDIYFWIDWVAVTFEMGSFKIRVNPLYGVFKISFQLLLKILKNAPLHSYAQRRNDTKGNAKQSYVLDIRHELFTCLINTPNK